MKVKRTGVSGSTVLSVMTALADRNCSACHCDREKHLDLTQPELYIWPPSRNDSHQGSMLHKHKIPPMWCNCILFSFPLLFQSIDTQRVYYSNFISNSQRHRSLWQRIPWNERVMLFLSVIAIISCVSSKRTCCGGTPWMCLHWDPQAGSEWVRFRTGSDTATVPGLIILLFRGYSLGSQHNADAGILFLWAKLFAALQCW